MPKELKNIGITETVPCDEHKLLDSVGQARQAFGTKCSKFVGSVTVELLRAALLDMGIKLSLRDVFIHGIPVEVDLLLPTPAATSDYGLVYQPEDVLAAFEVKNAGAFGESTLSAVRRSFDLIRAVNPRIYCAYVTLAEREGYKWAATKKNIGADVFTLFWHNGSMTARHYKSSGDWSRLMDELKRLTVGGPEAAG